MFLETDVAHYSFSGVNDLSSNPFLQLILDLKTLKLLPHQLRASSTIKCYCCNTALMLIVESMIKQIIFLLTRSFRQEPFVCLDGCIFQISDSLHQYFP